MTKPQVYDVLVVKEMQSVITITATSEQDASEQATRWVKYCESPGDKPPGHFIDWQDNGTFNCDSAWLEEACGDLDPAEWVLKIPKGHA